MAIHQETKTSCRDKANQCLNLQCVNPSSRKTNYQIKIDQHTARTASSSLRAWTSTDQKTSKNHRHGGRRLYKVRKAYIWKWLPMVSGGQQEAITLGWKSTNIRKSFKQSNIPFISQIQERSSKNAQHSRHPALKRPLLCKTKAVFCYVSSQTELKLRLKYAPTQRFKTWNRTKRFPEVRGWRFMLLRECPEPWIWRWVWTEFFFGNTYLHLANKKKTVNVLEINTQGLAILYIH